MPPNWDENLYLKHNVDLRKLIKDGVYKHGYAHFVKEGHAQDRKGGFLPADWHEEHIFASTKMWLRPFKTQSILVDMIITLVLATLRA